MHKLLVDTGVEEFEVNGRGVLRFNPGDPNLYHRFFAAREELAALDEELTRQSAALPEDGGGAALALLADYDRRIKALLNRVFGTPNDFDVLLDGVNLAGVGTNGRRVVENLLEALTPILQAGAQHTVEATARQAVAAADAARAARGGQA